MSEVRTCATALAASLALALSTLPVLAQTPSLFLEPSVIEMGPMYGGARLRVRGTVSSGTQVAVVVRGPESEELFNKKARMGPIWVNQGKVHVSGAPSLFLCFTSGPLEGMLDRKSLDEYLLDQKALLARMVIRPEASDQEAIRASYLALKLQQGAFQAAEGSIRLDPGNGPSAERFTLDLAWPKRAPPDSYEVVAYECRGRAVMGQASAKLEVREVGFPLTLAELAKDRAALYGALCVVIAMIAGFGIDFLVTRMAKQGLVGH